MRQPWYVIATEDGYIGDPGAALMNSSFSKPMYDLTGPDEAWKFVTLNRAWNVMQQLKGTKQWAGEHLFIVPVDH